MSNRVRLIEFPVAVFTVGTVAALSCSPAYAGSVTACNRTTAPVYVALIVTENKGIMFDRSQIVRLRKGWFTVTAKSCMRVFSDNVPLTLSAYVYAESDKGQVWRSRAQSDATTPNFAWCVNSGSDRNWPAANAPGATQLTCPAGSRALYAGQVRLLRFLRMDPPQTLVNYDYQFDIN